MTRRIVALVAGVVILGSATAFAHHSFSATYTGEKVEIEGVVKEFVWRNPHSFLRMDVADKDGTLKTWALEWGSISQLSQSKMTRTTLKVGDKIVVSGEQGRDPSSLRLLIQSVRRPSDGWTWNGKVE